MEDLVRRYRKLIMESDNKQELFDQLYREYKMRVFDYFDGTTINKDWDNCITDLLSIEKEIPLEYIIDASISINVNEKLEMSINRGNRDIVNKYGIEDVLDYLVYYGRDNLVVDQNIKMYDDLDVTNKCKIGAKKVDDMAKTCGLNHRLVRIDPGFSYVDLLLNGSGYHYFNLIEHKGKKCLVDVTYKQFFRKYRCSLERLGIPKLFPPLAGAFMVRDDLRMIVAKTLLNRGWIELTPDVVKAYFDGFALSYRNGLYYEDKEIVFETDYTRDNYKDFLCGVDNQVRHEGKSVLGYQLRPLKNPSIRFK